MHTRTQKEKRRSFRVNEGHLYIAAAIRTVSLHLSNVNLIPLSAILKEDARSIRLALSVPSANLCLCSSEAVAAAAVTKEKIL